jgi:hypothetical protein
MALPTKSVLREYKTLVPKMHQDAPNNAQATNNLKLLYDKL